MNADRIEKSILLRAPRTRVWRAISSAEEFGAWFGIHFEGHFVPGVRLRGQITVPGSQHLAVDFDIEEMEPEHRFSYRWHPYAIEPSVDYSEEPMTFVEFLLADAPGGTELNAGGTELRVVESGFDRIPAARRAEAFRMDDEGWTEQLGNIKRHVGD